MTPSNYKAIRDQLRKSIGLAEEEIKHCFGRVIPPPMEELRPMEMADVKDGQLVYYLDGDKWMVVEVCLMTPEEAGRYPTFTGRRADKYEPLQWFAVAHKTPHGTPYVERAL